MTPQREKHENWEVPLIETKRKQKIQLIFLLIYIFTVLWFTVLSRPTGYHVAQLELFWSYKRWLAGDMNLGIVPDVFNSPDQEQGKKGRCDCHYSIPVFFHDRKPAALFYAGTV